MTDTENRSTFACGNASLGHAGRTRMTIQDQEFFEVATPTGPMRVHRFYPKDAGLRPAIILYSEIYQVTGPIRRLAAQVACEGYEVLVPEVYHEYEEPGKVLASDTVGTE